MIAFYSLQDICSRGSNKHQLNYDLICDAIIQDETVSVDSSDFLHLLQPTTSFYFKLGNTFRKEVIIIIFVANSNLINHYTIAPDGIPIYLLPVPVFRSLGVVGSIVNKPKLMYVQVGRMYCVKRR